MNLGSRNNRLCQSQADDSGILEELLKNSERNQAKSKAGIVDKPAYSL